MAVALSLAELPETLPVFPLVGVLLLPRGRLPLNIFEPRYVAMIEALFARLDGRLGTLSRGKIADIVLLDDDPLADIRNTRRIFAVIQAGHLFTRTDLDAILAQVRSDVAR